MLKLYENIKKRRLELKMSQESLAERMGYYDKSMISKIERGKIDIPQSKIMQFAKVLDIDAGNLMGWEDEEVSGDSAMLTHEEWELIKGFREIEDGDSRDRIKIAINTELEIAHRKKQSKMKGA